MTITDPLTPAETRPILTRLGAAAPATSGCASLHRVSLRDGRAGGVYRRRGRWAITWRGVQATPGREAELALSEYLDVVRRLRLRPLFVGVIDPWPLRRRGLDTYCYAHEAVLDLARFDLARFDPARRGLNAAVPPGMRRQVETAARAGWQVTRYQPEHVDAVARFIPSAAMPALHTVHDPDGDAVAAVESWVAVDPSGTPRGIATWHNDAGGSARTLRRAAADPQAYERAVPLLITHAAATYRACGVTALHLGWRPRMPWWPTPDPRDTATGPGLSAVVATRFAPTWRTRWLALPSAWQLPAAALALR